MKFSDVWQYQGQRDINEYGLHVGQPPFEAHPMHSRMFTLGVHIVFFRQVSRAAMPGTL